MTLHSLCSTQRARTRTPHRQRQHSSFISQTKRKECFFNNAFFEKTATRVVIFTVCLLLFPSTAATANSILASSSSSSLGNRVSVDLNPWLPLQHAAAACSQRGRLISVLVIDQTLYVAAVAVQRQRIHVQQPKKNKKLQPKRKPRRRRKGLVTWLNYRSNHRNSSFSSSFSSVSSSSSSLLGIICSGVQADARWLVKEIQTIAHKQWWTRYNIQQPQDPCFSGLLPITLVVECIVSLYRRFGRSRYRYASSDTSVRNDYDHNDDWTHPHQLPSSSSSDTDSDEWARPLGVTTLLLQTFSPSSSTLSSSFSSLSSDHDQDIPIVWMDPSGVARPIPPFYHNTHNNNNDGDENNAKGEKRGVRVKRMWCCCIGPNSAQVQQRIQEQAQQQLVGLTLNENASELPPQVEVVETVTETTTSQNEQETTQQDRIVLALLKEAMRMEQPQPQSQLQANNENSINTEDKKEEEEGCSSIEVDIILPTGQILQR